MRLLTLGGCGCCPWEHGGVAPRGMALLPLGGWGYCPWGYGDITPGGMKLLPVGVCREARPRNAAHLVTTICMCVHKLKRKEKGSPHIPYKEKGGTDNNNEKHRAHTRTREGLFSQAGCRGGAAKSRFAAMREKGFKTPPEASAQKTINLSSRMLDALLWLPMRLKTHSTGMGGRGVASRPRASPYARALHAWEQVWYNLPHMQTKGMTWNIYLCSAR